MKNAMILCALLLIASMAWLSCGEDNPVSYTIDHYEEEPFFYTVDVQNQTRLRLAGITGSVEVAGLADANAIIISGCRRVGSYSTAEATAHLKYLRVDVQDLEDEVIVSTIQPSGTERVSYTVNYTITLPPALEVLVNNEIGTVAVDEVDNMVRVDASIGNVTICQINGDVQVDAANGTVILDQIEGNVCADVLNGGVDLRKIYGNVHADVKNGHLNCQAILPPEGVIDLRTVNGSSSLQIPENTSAQLTASVTAGRIDISNLSLQDPCISDTFVSGQLREGNGTICLKVINGNVNISTCLDWH